MTGEARNVIIMVTMAEAEMSIRMGVDMTDRMTVVETVLVIGETSVTTRNQKEKATGHDSEMMVNRFEHSVV